MILLFLLHKMLLALANKKAPKGAFFITVQERLSQECSVSSDGVLRRSS